MKYLSLLVVLAIIYFVFARQSPVASVQEAVAQSEVQPLTPGAPGTAPVASTSLKRPIDRTKEVLNQVKTRNGTGEF